MHPNIVLLNRNSLYSQTIRLPNHLLLQTHGQTVLFPDALTNQAIREGKPLTDGQLALEGNLEQPFT